MSNREIFDPNVCYCVAHVFLVAGMSNREIFDEFMVIGGTELSPMRCACARVRARVCGRLSAPLQTTLPSVPP